MSQKLEAANVEHLRHEDALSLEGLDDIFKWASEVVADGEDNRVKRAREQRIRRQVLEVVQKSKEDQAKAEAKDEIAYLQRRVIALLQRVQDVADENSQLKQINLAQQFTLSRMPELEAEVKRLQFNDFERQDFRETQIELVNTLSKLKKDRDFLEDLVLVNEKENDRLVTLLQECKSELTKIKARRWWHIFTGRRA